MTEDKCCFVILFGLLISWHSLGAWIHTYRNTELFFVASSKIGTALIGWQLLEVMGTYRRERAVYIAKTTKKPDCMEHPLHVSFSAMKLPPVRPSSTTGNEQAFMVWNFGDVLGCVVLLVLIKIVIVALVMKSFGFSWEASTLAGACMAQVWLVL